MLKHLASVGGFTLLSRLTGFVNSIVLADVLGAGRLADAFFVAFRIPNHFRAIFAEGAFNAAYVPAYSQLKVQDGDAAAGRFASQIFTLLLLSQLLILAPAYVFMDEFVGLLAPGYAADPEKFALAKTMTRITFPYLLCMVLVTLHSATLNANRHFAVAAFAPVLLNLSMIAALGLAFVFPNAGIAASAGVMVSGLLQLALLMAAARRAGVLERLALPRWNADIKLFFTRLLPAVIGSAGTQIAIFADTIIASTLPDGGQSSINYADRLYQLPLGVIGIAAGTVLLPEMSRRIAQGDEAGASKAQNRTLALTLTLTLPFCIAFLGLPQLILEAAFVRGNFTSADAQASAAVLAAYGTGLLAAVCLRSVVASFQSRGDLRTPMVVSIVAVAVNVALKLLLTQPYGAPGLALATSAGIWINLALLVAVALRRGLMQMDAILLKPLACAANAGLFLTLAVLWLDPLLRGLAAPAGNWAALLHLALAGVAGLLVYFGLLLAQMRLLGLALPLTRRGGGQR